MSWYKYSSKVLSPGFELKSDGGDPISVCPTAEWTTNHGKFTHEFDHAEAKAEYENFRFLDVTRDSADGMPVVNYEVDEELHKLLQSDQFNGVSPVITVNEVNEKSKTFTKFTIDGISFQFEAAPACPDSFCPTEYQGGDRVGKDEEIVEETTDEETTDTETTEEPPKKVVKKKVVKTPAKDVVEQAIASTEKKGETQAEYVARLIRQNEDYETRLKAVEADLATRDAAKRKELLDQVPEASREWAEKLESEALVSVVNILKNKEAVDKEKTDATTIVEAGAVETTDASTDQKKKTEETTGDNEEKDPEEEERDFFDMSSVFTVSEEKSGLYR